MCLSENRVCSAGPVGSHEDRRESPSVSQREPKGIFIGALTGFDVTGLRPRVVQTPNVSCMVVLCSDDEDLNMYPVIPME